MKVIAEDTLQQATDSNQKADFYRKMERLLNVGPGSITGDQELKSLKSWDSLTILEFIVLADEEYKSEVQPADISACRTVNDLADLTFKESSVSHESLHTGN